jgi:hypothetical protein
VDRQIAFTGPLKIRTFMADKEVSLQGLTVWCRMSSRGFVGPLFFEGTVTVPSYLNLFWISIVPAIRRQYGNGEFLCQRNQTNIALEIPGATGLKLSLADWL